MGGLTLKQLKALCKKYKLPVSGTKKQLTQRLRKSAKLSKKDKLSLKSKKTKKKSKKSGMFGLAEYLGFGNPQIEHFQKLEKEHELPQKLEKQREKHKHTKVDLASIVNPEATNLIVEDRKIESMRPQWDIERSVEVLIPRIKEVAANFDLKGDEYDYERKIHVVIGSKLAHDEHIPHLVLTLDEAETLDTKSLNELFRQRGKFIHKDQVDVAHSNFESEYEYELFPESSFSKEMKKEFKDLYSWEQRFDSGLDGIDRTSMFRKKQTYQPKYKTEEGVRFQYYDLFDKKFINP